jgi:hypothetical protein
VAGTVDAGAAVVGGEVGAAVVGDAVVGDAVVGAVVVLLDEDDLVAELHPPTAREITIRPAPMHIHHGCRLIDHPLAPSEKKNRPHPTITRLRFLNRAVGPYLWRTKGHSVTPEVAPAVVGPQKPPGNF